MSDYKRGRHPFDPQYQDATEPPDEPAPALDLGAAEDMRRVLESVDTTKPVYDHVWMPRSIAARVLREVSRLTAERDEWKAFYHTENKRYRALADEAANTEADLRRRLADLEALTGLRDVKRVGPERRKADEPWRIPARHHLAPEIAGEYIWWLSCQWTGDEWRRLMGRRRSDWSDHGG